MLVLAEFGHRPRRAELHRRVFLRLEIVKRVHGPRGERLDSAHPGLERGPSRRGIVRAFTPAAPVKSTAPPPIDAKH